MVADVADRAQQREQHASVTRGRVFFFSFLKMFTQGRGVDFSAA